LQQSDLKKRIGDANVRLYIKIK